MLVNNSKYKHKTPPYLALRKERDSGLSQQITLFLESRQLSIKSAQESNDIQTIIALVAVAAGVGISLLPYSARHISHHDVCFIPIKDPPLSQHG